MSDPMQNFEFILKKSNSKGCLGLYSDSKQPNKHNYKPQDVISSVFSQLKAIQGADSFKSEKSVPKTVQKNKKSSFVSVNNLPVCEEAAKTTTKFDTQCVSDTQLINIIEDAEIIDVHQGMTQEFEIDFVHNTEKQEIRLDEDKEDENVYIDEKDTIPNILNGMDSAQNTNKEIIINIHSKNKSHDNITKRIHNTRDDKKNNIGTDIYSSEISPIMCSNTIIDTLTGIDTNNSTRYGNTQLDNYTQILNESIEIEDADMLLERPLSPIFMPKAVKKKSKSPSPLVFNLDSFEKFEKIAIPILETNDLNTAKQVINSQILDKELHINMDEKVHFDDRDILSPVLQNPDTKVAKTEFKTVKIKDKDLDTDLEFIELDKATSDDLVNKVINEDYKMYDRRDSEVLKDEILFSSDEEDNYVPKSYQDLPFTCALETSFYNQSGVLDKTMYVGFQTASNKSIQIFTESFAHAKSILSDEVTVTDLVRNCDGNVGETQGKMDLIEFSNSGKNKDIHVEDDQGKIALIDFGTDEKENNVHINVSHGEADLVDLESVKINKEILVDEVPAKLDSAVVKNDEIVNEIEMNVVEEPDTVLPNNNVENNFEGFMTASKKTIQLSQKALARCKKVFQDIDLNENFDTQEDIVIKNEPRCVDLVNDYKNIEIVKSVEEDIIHNIDDDILQEFENIEMSVKDDDKTINKDESSVIKFNDDLQDIDFEEDMTEIDLPRTTTGDKRPENTIENTNLKFEGFKTASNKNIKISTEAITKTKNIFQDIDLTELPNKSTKSFEDENQIVFDIDQPSTSKANFIGFKTANNKNIKVSEQALAKTRNIFQNIDDMKLPVINKKNTQDNNSKENYFKVLSSNETTFMGFKTGNNKDIEISKDAVENSKKIFENIDSIDFIKNSDISTKNRLHNLENFINLDQPSISKSSFIGFKTASNKNVKISDAALAKTTNIFKDIDSTDFRFPEKGEKNEIIDANRTKLSFKGFKTANNKEIEVSVEALPMTKDIFQGIDSDDSKFPLKLKENQEVNIKHDDGNNTEEEMLNLNIPSTSKNTFLGFKTGNNKKIDISKKALAKTKNIFEGIDEKDFKLPEKPSKDTRTIKLIENITKPQDKTNPQLIKNQPLTNIGFVGFKTANNRNITISKESLAKTKNIFKDIENADFTFPEKVSQNVRKSDITEQNTTERENNKCNETEIDETVHFNQPSTSEANFTGFKTANNKRIHISEESLSKTKNIFKDIDSNDIKYPKELCSKVHTEKEDKSPYPVIKEVIQPSTSETSFVGFKTANNKVINITETALAKTKNIFKDLNTIEIKKPEKKKDDYPIFDNKDDESEPNCKRNKDIEIKEVKIHKFQGFQTASNKQVKISEQALVKSRKLFENINLERFNSEIHEKDDLHTVQDVISNLKGTAINFDVPNTDLDIQSSLVIKPFQSDINKTVPISKTALIQSRKLFEDIEILEDGPEPEFRGFNTKNEDFDVPHAKIYEHIRDSFKGFQTASDKKVIVSEKALAESRKICQNVNENLKNKRSNINFGFKTGSNQGVKVCEKAVVRSKRLFSEIDQSNSKEDVSNMIDTQVLNNFNESLHTEDFSNTPMKSKRSGSPILSCPKAKRRKKFETPYSQILPKPIKNKSTDKIENTNRITFTENYKKNKKYCLKDLQNFTKEEKTKIDPYLLSFNFENLHEFKFDEGRNGLSNDTITMDKLKELFTNSANSKLIPNGWLDNHLKLILWKLISYEIKFKYTVRVRDVLDQLKYRYDRELYHAQRPALRKILEKDDVPSKTIVLCVAAVYVDGVAVTNPTSPNNLELLLTDGWYCIKTSIDKMLAQLVCQGKIVVGSKIVTNGAELVNCEQGMSPWENTSAVRLKIFGNSTRRARWDARLGYHGNAAILSELSTVKLDGGKVSKLRVYVTRVYPALYVEKFEDGSTVTRSERLEHLHQMKTETERQSIMEKIYEEVEKDISDQDSQDSEGLSDSNKRSCLDSGSQIAKVMKRSKDPGEFRAALTSSQSRLLEHYTCKRREVLLQDIERRVRDKMQKAGVCVNRNVVTLLKIRVAGVTWNTGLNITKGMMSIWKPTDAILDIIKEGAWIDIMNVVPTAVRYSEIQISAGRQSVFSKSKYKESEKLSSITKLLKRNCYTIKDLAQNPSMTTDYNEIDTIGFIFLIDPSIQEFESTKQPFQNVYLSDIDKNIICINFWGGLKKFGYQNVLDTGQIVYCGNLQKRAGNTRKSIPHYRVTEFSYFTKTPKSDIVRNLIVDLSKQFHSLDRRKFCEDCIILKNNYTVLKNNNENVSPYGFNKSDYNISKHKIFIDSPLARPKIDDVFNLTGLDFESTFRQTDTQNLTEEVLLRKKKVNEKIARLKMYGEPPPLSTIHIINRSKNASNSYKSPLNPNNNNSKILLEKSSSDSVQRDASESDSYVNVASLKETPGKCGDSNNSVVACSPVLNRTYVKNVNPTKINFDVKDNNDSNFDHFAEEFDGSPPLSLD